MKYILFVGENTAGTNDIKMRQAIQTKIVFRLGRNRFCTQAREKGPQWFAELNAIRYRYFPAWKDDMQKSR